MLGFKQDKFIIPEAKVALKKNVHNLDTIFWESILCPFEMVWSILSLELAPETTLWQVEFLQRPIMLQEFNYIIRA